MKFYFIGEEPSPLALKMKVTWTDGRLAAKQLFDALAFCEIDPQECGFVNLFKKGKVQQRVLQELKRSEVPLVAMGKKVQRVLSRHQIDYLPLIHPAARGHIRKKENYFQHVKEVLIHNGISV